MHASASRFVLVLLLIGRKSGANLLSQSRSVVIAKPITFRHSNENRSNAIIIIMIMIFFNNNKNKENNNKIGLMILFFSVESCGSTVTGKNMPLFAWELVLHSKVVSKTERKNNCHKHFLSCNNVYNAKREIFVSPAANVSGITRPHLPEHLFSRYVILYACVTKVSTSDFERISKY